jgi:hypothetical protein
MGAFYRTGTVSVTNGDPDVVGVGTLWLSQASVGDIFVGPDLDLYEITAVADNLNLSVKQLDGTAAYAGATLSAQNYAIIRNFTSTVPAQLASNLAELMENYHVTLDDMVNWLSGTGSVTIHDAVGNAYTVKTPAALEAEWSGRLSKSVAGAVDVTLTSTEAGNSILRFYGTLTGNINVIVPADSHTWVVTNDTTGSYSLTLKTPSGTGVVITQGTSALVFCDGTNVVTTMSSIVGPLSVSGAFTALSTMAVTGAITAASTIAAGDLISNSKAFGSGPAASFTNTTTNGYSLIKAIGDGTGGGQLAFLAGATNRGGIYGDSTGVTIYTGTSTVSAFFTSTGINNTVIGATTPAAASVTTLAASNTVTISKVNTALAVVSTATNSGYASATNTVGTAYWGQEGTGANKSFTGTTDNAAIWGSATNVPAEVLVNTTKVASFTSTGLAVTGTGSFSGTITSTTTSFPFLTSASTGTGRNYQSVSNTGGGYTLGVESSVGGSQLASDTAYSTVLTTTGTTDLYLGTNVTARLKLDGSTGLATFNNSLSVTGTLSTTGDITYTLSQNSTDSIKVINANTGTSAIAEMRVSNDTTSLFMAAGGTSYSGVLISGGVTGYHALSTFGAVGLSIGTNLASAINISSSQAVSMTNGLAVTGTGSFTGNFTLSSATAGIIMGTAAGYGYIGNSTGAAYLEFDGPSHATTPNQAFLRAASYNFKNVGGTTLFDITASGDAVVQSGRYLMVDGGGDTGIRESSANVMQMVVAGSDAMRVHSTGIAVSGATIGNTTAMFKIRGNGSGYGLGVEADNTAVMIHDIYADQASGIRYPAYKMRDSGGSTVWWEVSAANAIIASYGLAVQAHVSTAGGQAKNVVGAFNAGSAAATSAEILTYAQANTQRISHFFSNSLSRYQIQTLTSGYSISLAPGTGATDVLVASSTGVAITGTGSFTDTVTSTKNGTSFNISISSGQNGIYQITNGTRTIRMAHAADDSLYVGTTSSHNWYLLQNGSAMVEVNSSGIASAIANATWTLDHDSSSVSKLRIGGGLYGSDTGLDIGMIGSGTSGIRATSTFVVQMGSTRAGAATVLSVTTSGMTLASGAQFVRSAGTNTVIDITNTSAANPTAIFRNDATSGDNLFAYWITDAGTLRGTVDYNRGGGAVRYNTTSNGDLKNIHGDADKQISRAIILDTRIRSYSWKDNPTRNQIGVIAQEVLEMGFTGAVSLNANGVPSGVDKTAWVFHTIATLQLHDEDIEFLKAENAAMRAILVANNLTL